jgi:hypothetical protein
VHFFSWVSFTLIHLFWKEFYNSDNASLWYEPLQPTSLYPISPSACVYVCVSLALRNRSLNFAWFGQTSEIERERVGVWERERERERDRERQRETERETEWNYPWPECNSGTGLIWPAPKTHVKSDSELKPDRTWKMSERDIEIEIEREKEAF